MTHPQLDAKNRELAIHPQESFIIQAPAGSGKTELLTQRYLSLLAHVTKPEEIIAITFTRKAAAEMRHRIIKALNHAQKYSKENLTKKYIENLPPHQQVTLKLALAALSQDKHHEWCILENPNRLRILTIDSLANRISNQMPILAGFGATPRICENAKRYYQQAIFEIIELFNVSQQKQVESEIELPAWQRAFAQLLIHLDNRIYKIEQLFIDMLKRREQWLPYLLHWRTTSFEKVQFKQQLEQGLKQLINEQLNTISTLLPSDWIPELIALLQIAADYFLITDPSYPLVACLSYKTLPPSSYHHLKPWRAIAQWLLTQEGQWRKTIDKRQGFPTESKQFTAAQCKINKQRMKQLVTELNQHNKLRQHLQTLLVMPDAAYSENQWEILEAFSQILPILVAQLRVIFQQEGLIDFIELNLAAQHALGNDENPTDLALYLDYEIRHLLIDEFQDTSVIQFKLIEQLIAGWQPQDGRTIFLVGDPMQSIYRFRNAEVSLFLRTARQGIGGLTLQFLTLQRNFRSENSLINWVNQCFPKIFPADKDLISGAVPYTTVEATQPQTHTQHDVHFYTLPKNNRIAEANQVINIIQQLQGHHPTDTIAILVRTRSQLSTILASLHKNQLKFDAVAIEPLINYPEIKDLLTLTQALIHRADRTAWLSLLRAPWCGLTLADLLQIAQTAQHTTIWQTLLNPQVISFLTEDGRLRIQRVLPILARGFQQQGRMRFSHWLESIWLMLGGPAILNDTTAHSRVRTFFHLLDELTTRTPLFSINRLTQELTQLYAESDYSERDDPSITDQPTPKIQIMTIHKAKGLEFDHVLIPGLNQTVVADPEKLLLWLERPNLKGENDLILAPIKARDHQQDAIYHYLAILEKQKLNYENARLFYVAATRAKKSLHLFGNILSEEIEETSNDKEPKPANGSFLQMIWPFYESLSLQQEKNVASENVISSLKKNTTTPSLWRLSNYWQLPELPFKGSLQLTMPTEPELVWINLPLTNIEQRNLGTIIHETLQQIASIGTLKWSQQFVQYRSYWKQRLLALGTSQSALEQSYQRIETTIESVLTDPRGLWILDSNHLDAHHEYALTGLIKNKLHHIIIDRTFIDYKTKTRWIIDYKITEPKPEETLINFLQKEKNYYFNQVEEYAQIVGTQSGELSIKIGLYFPLCCGWQEWGFVGDTFKCMAIAPE